MIQILVMWPVVEQFSREPCFIYMAINCKEPTACFKMNSTGSDTVLKEAVLNSGQSRRLPSLGSVFLYPKLYYHKSCKNCLSLQGCSLSSVKAHERGERSNSCDSSSLTFFFKLLTLQSGVDSLEGKIQSIHSIYTLTKQGKESWSNKQTLYNEKS